MKKLFGVLSLALAATSFAAFSESSFNYGAMWEGIKDRSDRASLGLSHVAMYIGDANTQWSDRVNQPYNPYWEADMVKFCAQNDITPVFYAYVIAEWDKHLGYSDCDVGSPNHCTNGAETIRNDWQTILWRYGELAKGVASDMGSKKNTIPSIWLIEPDFYQYSVSGDNQRGGQQSGGGIPDAELAGTRFNQIVAAIKQHLPNAKIAVDISPWISNPQGWYSNFDASKIDYMFTSGGRTEGNNSKIRSENNMTWAQASGFLGKKIIADDGYGVGGGAENNYGDWQNVNNLKSRVADGVIGLTIKSPSADFMSWTKSNPISLGNSGSTQQPSSSSNRPSYSSSSSATNTGSGNSNSNLAIKPTRVGPVSQYGQLQIGKNSSGQGRIYGSCPSYSSSGNEVQVQGMSLFWAISSDVGAPFWTSDYVKGLVDRQNIQLIRAPMGVDDNWGAGNYFTDKNRYQTMMNNVVQSAIENDIYVIIDYHSHKASDNVNNAKDFFAYMAQKWGGYDNVIFEVFNEPLEGVAWSTIKGYADEVVKTIRQYSDNLVLVGNRNWDQYPSDAIGNTVSDSKNNTAYTFHFYAGSHSTGNEGSHAVQAMNAGLSVFVSEWGTVDASGNGGFSSGNSATWLSWMNQHKLSGANWSVSNKDESASYFQGSAWNYSESGQWVNTNIFSKLPTSYKACSGGAVTPQSSSSIASSSSALPAGYTNYIDDFEDGDSLAFTGGVWYAYTDKDDKGASTLKNTAIVDKNGEAGYDVVVKADNNTKNMGALQGVTLSRGQNEYEPYVALGLKLNADEKAYDLSKCNTITYKYKGASHNFKAEDTQVTDYAYHYIAKLGSSSWTEASISWNVLMQPEWGKSVSLSKARINKFTWEIKGDLKGTQPDYNYLYIDDVKCDGIAIKPVVATPVSSSSSVASSSSESSSSVASSSSSVPASSESSAVAGDWTSTNTTLVDVTGTGVSFGPAEGYNPDRIVTKILDVEAGVANTVTFNAKVNQTPSFDLNASIGSCSETVSLTAQDQKITCVFTPAENTATLTVTVPGGNWQTVTISDLKVVSGVTVVAPPTIEFAADNATQEIVAGVAIKPIVLNLENATSITVEGLPKGLTAALSEDGKTYTISGTVDATLGTHDYEYVVTVVGESGEASAKGTIKVTRAPIVTEVDLASGKADQEVVAGNAIEPIVFSYANATSVAVEGLPKGLTAVLNQEAKTYTISGTIDAELGTHDYEYIVTIAGEDNDAVVTGTIKVTRAPVVTKVDLNSADADQSIVAGEVIKPIVLKLENATSVTVAGLPQGLTAVLSEDGKTYTISGTVDATLGTHDYEYTVTVKGLDNDATANGVIKVTRAPLVTVFAPAAENTTQNVVAGQPIAPIVFNFENVSSISVDGLPKGLTAVLDETAKTYTISGAVDAELGTHDYEYTVSVTGVDENTTATGVIKVTRAPVVTKVDLNSADADQSIVAGEAIKPIVLKLENATSVTVAGLPQGLTAELSEDGKTYTISGTVDATLGSHDYEYTVTVKGLDNDATANGVIKVTEIVVEESSSSVEESSSSSEVVESSSSAEPESSSSSVEEPASSSSEETGAKCIAYTGGNVYKDVCYSSGLIGQETGKCYRVSDASSSQVNASGNNWLGNSSIANNAWWWTEVDCGETPASSSSEEVVESSSSVEESSSSSEVVESSSSEEPVVSSSSEAPESSSSAEPESSSSSVEEPVVSSSSETLASSSSEEVVESSSSVEESSSSSEVEESSSSEEPVVSSSSEAPESSSSAEPESSSSSVEEPVVSSSSETPASSSSEEVVESSSSVEENSSSSEDIESSSSEEPESSSSEDPWNMRTDVRPTLALSLNGRALTIVGAQNVNVDVFDMQGRPIRAFRQVSGQVSLDGVKAGNYIVRVREGSNSLTRRIAIR